MSKTVENPAELVEADFKELQRLLETKYGKEYTLSYIRKVCKGTRTNANIRAMAEDYIDLQKELKSKMQKLAS